MITLSLNEIRKHSPCKSGWETLLKSKPNADWNEQFPLSDIIDSNGLNDTLWCLRVRPEHSNLWRKYAVWCARQVERFMTDERSKSALDVAWRHSEGEATDEELAAARAAAGVAAERNAAWAAEWAAADVSERAAADAAGDTARAAWVALAAAYAADAAGYAAWDAARDAARAARDAAWEAPWNAAWDAAGAANAAWDAAGAAQEKKLREILQTGEWR